MRSLWRVFGHLIFLFRVATFFIEGNIGVAAVKNCLVAATVLADMCEGLDDAHTQFFPLLTLVDSDIFDVADGTKTPQELVLNEDSAYANDFVSRLVDDDYAIVRLGQRPQGTKLSHPRVLPEIVNHGEHGEHG